MTNDRPNQILLKKLIIGNVIDDDDAMTDDSEAMMANRAKSNRDIEGVIIIDSEMTMILWPVTPTTDKYLQ